MEIHHAKGEALPVAVSFGHSIPLYLAASAPIRRALCEYNYAAAIEGTPVDVVKGEVTGLPLPASGEIVAEGFIKPGDLRNEGPFGEFTGYYGGAMHEEPVISIEALYYRNDPIILGSPPGKPPFDHSYWRTVLESALLKDRLEVSGVPDVKGVWRYESGCSQLFTVISVRQRYPGHARQAGVVASECAESFVMGRYIIVVDDDIDPSDIMEVIWALSTRTDPERSIDIIRGTTSSRLDPIIRKTPDASLTTSRAIIDACKPYEWIHEFPKVAEASPELKKRIMERWKDLFPGQA